MSTSFFHSSSILGKANKLHASSDIRPLALLDKGRNATVVGMAPANNAEELAVQTRLLELGFVPGEELRVVAEAFPGRDPIAVRLGCVTFALRRFEAAMVHVV